MSTTILIYLWGIADRFCECIFAMAVISGIMLGLTIMYPFFSEEGLCSTSSEKEERKKKLEACAKHRGRLIPTTILLLCIWGVTPSSNTIAAIAVIPKLIESQAVQKDLPEIYNAAVEKLKQSLK